MYHINDDGCDSGIFERYRITKTGKIWDVKSEKFVKTHLTNGYYRVQIDSRKYAVHRLVAKTFIPRLDGKTYVNHINENKEDNRAENLEWVTQKENTEKHSKEISHSRKVKCIDPKTKKVLRIYDQITEAAEDIGRSIRSIQHVLNGINQTAGGYFWEYLDVSHKKDNIDLSDGKKVYDYEKYIVFSDGRIYNTVNKKILKPVINAAGRAYVTLCKNNKKKNCYVHRIVADHYLPGKPHQNATVYHINNDLKDNRVENLKWSGSSQPSIRKMNVKNMPKDVNDS